MIVGRGPTRCWQAGRIYCGSSSPPAWKTAPPASPQRDNLTADKALAQVRRADRERADYCNSLSSVKWGEAASYDLCLDTQHLGLEGAAELIVAQHA